MFQSALFVVPCVLVAFTPADTGAEEVRVRDSVLLNDLRVVQDRRIYFAHQSVGANLLEGLNDLTRAAGAKPLRIAAYSGADLPAGGLLLESAIGENGSPRAKCDAFARNVERLSRSLDVAMMQFCFLDFNPNTDVEALFDYYRNTLDRVQAAHPGIRIVPVTAPLTTRPPL